MTAITQCKKCGVIYRFVIIDDTTPLCPVCEKKK